MEVESRYYEHLCWTFRPGSVANSDLYIVIFSHELKIYYYENFSVDIFLFIYSLLEYMIKKTHFPWDLTVLKRCKLSKWSYITILVVIPVYAAFVLTKYMYIYMKKCTDTNFKNDNKQLKLWELLFFISIVFGTVCWKWGVHCQFHILFLAAFSWYKTPRVAERVPRHSFDHIQYQLKQILADISTHKIWFFEARYWTWSMAFA